MNKYFRPSTVPDGSLRGASRFPRENTRFHSPLLFVLASAHKFDEYSI